MKSKHLYHYTISIPPDWVNLESKWNGTESTDLVNSEGHG